jgi:hypothetical protein
VRTAVFSMAMVVSGLACASAPTFGPLGESSVPAPSIISVDSAFPPHHATVKLDRPGYVALMLVAPGHSATLLYPNDSVTNNRFPAGAHQIAFQIPDFLAPTDSMRAQQRAQPRRDTSRLGTRARSSGGTMMPLMAETQTYLLVVTSPQQLHYRRILDKTAGVSIPLFEMEALNAVGKAIKSTIANEPREWAGYWRLIPLRRPR